MRRFDTIHKLSYQTGSRQAKEDRLGSHRSSLQRYCFFHGAPDRMSRLRRRQDALVLGKKYRRLKNLCLLARHCASM